MYTGTGLEQPGLNSETTRQPGTKTPLSTNTRNQTILARNHNSPNDGVGNHASFAMSNPEPKQGIDIGKGVE